MFSSIAKRHPQAVVKVEQMEDGEYVACFPAVPTMRAFGKTGGEAFRNLHELLYSEREAGPPLKREDETNHD